MKLMDSNIEVGDIVQAIHGSDKPTFGVVMEVLRRSAEYKCWMRTPTDHSAQAINFRLRAADCVKVGRARMRPHLPGDKQPRKPDEQPTTTKAQPVLPTMATVTPSVASSSDEAAPAGAISDPPPAEDVDPALLQTAVFRGPSAFDAHNLTPPVPTSTASEDTATATQDPLAPVKRKRHVRMKKRRGAK